MDDFKKVTELKVLNHLKRALIEGYELTKEEVLALKEAPIEALMEVADAIRQHFCGNTFDLCSIINGKSGACSEDCKYCAQSAYYKTCSEVYPLMEKEDILMDAKAHEAQGVLRYSIVTSGKRLTKKELARVCEIYKEIGDVTQLQVCASHGLLDREDFRQLKTAGVTRYHNNLETSRAYFPQICTTHTYEDKIQAIRAAQSVGLEVCSGGLFGMGESFEDRIDMAFELKALGIKSIPINILVPVSGTPFATLPRLTEEDILRSMACYRLIHKEAAIRLAGGRNSLTELGEKTFLGGINASITGNLLTTCGNTIANDIEMVRRNGYKVGLL